MRQKSNYPSHLRWRLLAGAALLAPAVTVAAPNPERAQDGVLVIDSTGASIQRERAPALISAADGFAAGYDNGAVLVDLSVLDGAQAPNQPIRLRPPPARRAIAAAPPAPAYVPQAQFAAAPLQLSPPVSAVPQLGMRLPPRRPTGQAAPVQLAVAPPRPAYQSQPGYQSQAAETSRPRSFSQSKVSLAPPPRLMASAPPPKARPQRVAKAPPPAPIPLSVALAPVLPERQPAPRPSPAAPPPKQAPLVRLAPTRPGLPPAASIRTPAAPPPVKPAPFIPKSQPAPPPLANVPAPPPLAPPPAPARAPAPIKFASSKVRPPYQPVQPPANVPAAVLALPPVLPVKNAPLARQPISAPPPVLSDRPNMVPPKLPAPEQPDRRLPTFSAAPPPLPAPPAARDDGLVTPPPLPTAALPPPPGLGPLERADRHQLASLPPKQAKQQMAPRSQIRQIASLPVTEPRRAEALAPPFAQVMAEAPLQPPALAVAPDAATRPMLNNDNPQLAALPPALRVEQARPVPAMAKPKLPPQPSSELFVPPARPAPIDGDTFRVASAEELLGGDATSGIEASDALKARFPIIFDRQKPPAMAQPGWTSAAPEAAIAAAKPANLAPLASLAPPRQPEEPHRQLAALPPPAPIPQAVPQGVQAPPQLPTLTSQPLPNLIQQSVAEPRPFNGVAKPRQVVSGHTNLKPAPFSGIQSDQPRIVRPDIRQNARPRLAPPRLPVRQAPQLTSPAPLPPAPVQSFAPPPSLIQPPQRQALGSRLNPASPLPQPIATNASALSLDGVTQPGSAVLAPPPPPARAPEIAARPESQSALPVPATEVSNQALRRGLSIPAGLARVAPPQQTGGDAPRRLLTPPPIDDLSKAPGFAPLPLPAPIAPPVAEAPALNASPPPPRLSELAPPARRTALAAPIRASNDVSAEIAFAGASRSLPGDAMPALAAIAERMKANPGLQARVSGAAATGNPGETRDVALARALAVQRYLLSRGVLSDAIKVQPVTGGQNRDGVTVTLVEPV